MMAIFPTYQTHGGQAAQSTLQARTAALPGQAQDVNRFLEMFQSYAPRGIQGESPYVAAGAAGRLMEGQGLEEKIAARNRLRNRFNTVLGRIAGEGATGSGFMGRARAEALPTLMEGEMGIAADEARARREGAGQVFGGLSSSLLGPDPVAEAFGREMGRVQQYGIAPGGGTRLRTVHSGVPGAMGYRGYR